MAPAGFCDSNAESFLVMESAFITHRGLEPMVPAISRRVLQVLVCAGHRAEHIMASFLNLRNIPSSTGVITSPLTGEDAGAQIRTPQSHNS